MIYAVRTNGETCADHLLYLFAREIRLILFQERVKIDARNCSQLIEMHPVPITDRCDRSIDGVEEQALISQILPDQLIQVFPLGDCLTQQIGFSTVVKIAIVNKGAA